MKQEAVHMNDQLLIESDQKEALSHAYVAAVAARAGYATSITGPDRDGVDVRICSGGTMRPALDLQLKATAKLGRSQNGVYRFPLKRRNYDTLRVPTQTPRILVVLELPAEIEQWLTVSQAKLVIRRAAYWTSLQGRSETSNKSSITVSLPADNLFCVEAVRALMEQSRQGAILCR